MLVQNIHIKTLKDAPTCFDHHSGSSYVPR